MTGLWIEFSAMAVDEPFKAIMMGIAMGMVISLGLILIKISCPTKTFKFRTVGKFICKMFYNIGHAMLLLLDLPRKIVKARKKARRKRQEKRKQMIEEAARRLVEELPKVEVQIRTIDKYTYCYDCDIHFNNKLPECPNCFAKNLAEGDAKSIFSILKGVREFRYLSFDREQDLIRFISEKMVGEPANGPEEKD